MMRTALSFLLLTTLLGTTQAAPVSTDEQEAERWYQIHVILFRQSLPGAESEELWRKNLQLSYPEALYRLKTPLEHATEFCEQATQPEGTEQPAATAREASPELQECIALLSADPSAQWPPSTQDGEPASPLLLTEEAAKAELASEEEQIAPFIPPPEYVAQASTDKDMQETLRSLRRSSYYQVLFANSWAQKLNDRASSPHVLVHAGQQFDEHFELEGHIKVSLERYLHVATDLWLSKFRPLGEELLFNSSMPAADGSAAPFQQAASVELADRIWPSLPIPRPLNDPSLSEEEPQEALPTESSRLEAGAPQPAQTESFFSAETAGMEGMAEAPATDDEVTNQPITSNLDILLAQDKQYYIERTVVMRQQRRMRSGELHYIDHPLFGMLVKITPLAPDETVSRDAPAN